jgi:WhiB family redox-sensing transcriptional regulator
MPHAGDLGGPLAAGRVTNSAGERSVDTDWMDRAACADSELNFVPETITEGRLIELRAVCAECPVKRECLEYALEQPYSVAWGVYAGTTPAERKALVA